MVVDDDSPSRPEQVWGTGRDKSEEWAVAESSGQGELTSMFTLGLARAMYPFMQSKMARHWTGWCFNGETSMPSMKMV